MFEPFPKLTRFSHGWTVSEKLDGTNSAIVIGTANPDNAEFMEFELSGAMAPGDPVIFAQSRTKLITPGKTTDNYGFAQFVKDNAEQLVTTLGAGRHFGEWVGAGIQRRYDMKEKVFALFNVNRWKGVELPNRVTTVPLLAEGYFGNPAAKFDEAMNDLKENGSKFAPGFMNAEGIVMMHGPSRTAFKKTFEYDEAGKWAEKESVK